MKRLLALLASSLLLSIPLAASAVTLEPLPGSAPQATRASAYFTAPIGVTLRDDAGAPIAGAEVLFMFDLGGPWVMFLGRSGWATTDANGVAVLSEGVVAGTVAGQLTSLRAVYGSTAQMLAPLTILPGPATQMIVAGGDHQVAEANTQFASPWSVQALDAEGLPVPYAWVMFGQSQTGSWAYATFGDETYVSVMADASGIATSPRGTAGSILGTGFTTGCGWGMACPQITFQVLEPAVPSLQLGVPPLSLERGKTTAAPFSVWATNADRAPMPGLAVTFSTEAGCGSFAGSAVVTTQTNAEGRADSPLFTALASERFCHVFIAVERHVSVIDLAVYEFSADHVVIDVPAEISVATSQPYQVQARFSADGIPVYAPPVDVRVTSAPNGASARIDPTGDDGESLTLHLFANAKSGRYAITVQRGPVQATIAVKQNGK